MKNLNQKLNQKKNSYQLKIVKKNNEKKNGQNLFFQKMIKKMFAIVHRITKKKYKINKKSYIKHENGSLFFFRLILSL